MRITGGSLGGRSLAAPKNKETRPTADATRETLFNVLQNGLGVDFNISLDLFAGSGAVAFETLSRGGTRAVLIESNKIAQTTIGKNAESLGLEAQIQVLRDESMDKWPGLLRKSLTEGQKFDFVFSDPPYSKGLAERSFHVLTQRAPEIFAEECFWVIELKKGEPAPKTPPGWKLVQERDSGAAKLVIYKRTYVLSSSGLLR